MTGIRSAMRRRPVRSVARIVTANNLIAPGLATTWRKNIARSRQLAGAARESST
jgi:hypothetical protein